MTQGQNVKDSKQINDEIEKTLDAFSHDTVLEGNPFLASRILAQIDGQAAPGRQKLRLSFSHLMLLLILLLNLSTILFLFRRNTESELKAQLVLQLKKDLQIEQYQDNL
jgi:hypothetical protein